MSAFRAIGLPAAVAILAPFPFIGYLGKPSDRTREEPMIRRWKIMPKRTLILAASALSFIAARTTIALTRMDGLASATRFEKESVAEPTHSKAALFRRVGSFGQRV